MRIRLIVVPLYCIAVSTMLAQNSTVPVTRSLLLEVNLPVEAFRANGIFRIGVAKSVLEMHATSEQVLISDVEILVFTNPSGEKELALNLMEELKSSFRLSGYELITEINDASYSWLWKDRSVFLLYTSTTKKESEVYIGAASQLPGYLQQRHEVVKVQSTALPGNEPLNTEPNTNEEISLLNAATPNSFGDIQPELVGNWGTLAGAKVNWRDESTGNMLVSGVSKGYGLELKADGTFLQSTIVTSGRPNYRVFVSTTGIWKVKGDQIWFYPGDRHYRKWENEIIMIDEHSVPELYCMFWRRQTHEATSKNCLYVRYSTDEEEQELCSE